MRKRLGKCFYNPIKKQSFVAKSVPITMKPPLPIFTIAMDHVPIAPINIYARIQPVTLVSKNPLQPMKRFIAGAPKIQWIREVSLKDLKRDAPLIVMYAIRSLRLGSIMC